MRDGADHLMTVEYDTKHMTTCPIRAIEQYIAVEIALGWNMTQGYLFPRISRRPNTGAPIRGKTPIPAPDMTKALKVHAHNARERTAFTMHSFKSGGALTRDLAGEDLSTVMQRAFWKKLSIAWRYLRLMEVLIPGSVGNSTKGGKEVWGNPVSEYKQEFDIRSNHQLYSIEIGPLVTGGRKHWRGKCDH